MMTICPECGKRHVVMWPQMNPFRRGDRYYCSHECWSISVRRDMTLIKDVARTRRGRKLNMKTKITEAMKAKAIEMAISGESPMNYLKECGSANPSASWKYIKEQLKKRDPEKFAQLPERIPKGKAEEEPKAAKEPVKEEPKAPVKPLVYDGYTVRCIEGQYGRFYWDETYNRLDWTTPDGEEISFSPQAWKVFCNEILPKVMAILGVNA